MLVVNEAAVLNARSGVMAVAYDGAFLASPKCIGFSGRNACQRRMA